MTTPESRRAVGIHNDLDSFLGRDHSLGKRLRMAVELHTTTTRLEGLILGCHSSDPRRVLLSRLNLHLTILGAGPRTTLAQRFEAAMASTPGASIDRFLEAVRTDPVR